MITLPAAYAVALFLVQYLSFPALLAALVVALLIYAADRFSTEKRWEFPKDYLGRLIYVVFNTAILTLVLTGVINIGDVSS
jgi:hypothetical protein